MGCGSWLALLAGRRPGTRPRWAAAGARLGGPGSGSRGEVGGARHAEAQGSLRPRAGVGDPDPGRHRDPRGGQRPRPGGLHEEPRVPPEIHAVQAPVDSQRLGQASRPRAQLGVAPGRRAPPAHGVEPLGGLEGAHEHGDPFPLRPTHDVQAVVQSVDGVHVGVAAGQPHGGVARRASAAEGVAGPVRRPQVGLGFDDRAGQAPPAHHAHQALAEQPAGHAHRIACEGGEPPRHPRPPAATGPGSGARASRGRPGGPPPRPRSS